MAELNAAQVPPLKERIFEVLNQADLSSVSAKKIRLALAEMPEGSLPEGLDLTAQKKAIDAVIRDCYNEITQKKSTAKTSSASSSTKKANSDKEKKPSAKKTTASKKRSKSDDDDDAPKKKRAPSANNPLSRPLRLSSEMAEVCGGAEMPRYEVVKKLWVYIKDRNLQNESNKRQVRASCVLIHVQIMCDEKLSGLFGKSTVEYVHFSLANYRFSSFEMAKVCIMAHGITRLTLHSLLASTYRRSIHRPTRPRSRNMYTTFTYDAHASTHQLFKSVHIGVLGLMDLLSRRPNAVC